jgi:diguanylate cyclase (GGDEF)-like protein
MNRRAFLAAMGVELARSERHQYPLAVMMLDVDHFKQINDARGHAAGDQVLAAIGGLLTRIGRKTDLAARWGGEEFVIGLTSTELEGGSQFAERVRRGIEELMILDGRERIDVTASVGLAVLRSGERVESLINRADRAMYAAKASGRNRVIIETPDASDSTSLGDTMPAETSARLSFARS